MLIMGGGKLTDFNHGDLKIYKSTDGGESWVEKASFAAQGLVGLQPLTIRGGMTWRRGAAWLTGNCVNHDAATDYKNFRSDDAGESWTPSGEIRSPLIDSPYEMPRALGGGIWLMPTRRTFDESIPGFTTLTIKKTTDYGASWNPSSDVPVPADAVTPSILTMCAITPQIIIAGGRADSTLDANYLPLWRSTDAGDSWSHLNAADVTGFPTSGDPPEIREIRRLTEDAAMLTWGPTQNDGDIPIAITLDKGVTWNTVPTMDGIDLTTGTMAFARAAIARNGDIITALTRFDGDNNKSQIISITLS
jgi:hypothetical protein